MALRELAVTLSMLLAKDLCFGKSPTEAFYESKLFHTIQLAQVFSDSKTFADASPLIPLREIEEIYKKESKNPNFNQLEFTQKYFRFAAPTADISLHKQSIRDRIRSLWHILERPRDKLDQFSNLVPLPFPYIVPGGRFKEVYYWDSYFTILGLAEDHKYELIKNIADNFAYLINTIGFIPNSNRSYHLTRSQPPFFSLIVELLADIKGSHEVLTKYLPQLEKEYTFWMQGKEKLKKPGDQAHRTVMLANGLVLNRYWDEQNTPRPESYFEDIETYKLTHQKNQAAVYRDIRSACESGWDFSSRWLLDQKSLQTIYTSQILPVDLNALLFHLEGLLERIYLLKGDQTKAKEFRDLAAARQSSFKPGGVFWSEATKFFHDWDLGKQKPTSSLHLAGSFPLYLNLATKAQAEKAVKTIENNFLRSGGYQTTNTISGQQWDAPNGWAPLQWVVFKALRNYGFDQLAISGAKRWLNRVESVYQQTGKLYEKYNVLEEKSVGSGGEYPTQDGFGWTNGVFVALSSELERLGGGGDHLRPNLR